MPSDHSTPIALITGGARGIGFEVCRQLAQRGMTVLLTARDLDKAEAAAQALTDEGLDVRPRALDVADDESVRALAASVAEEFGRLDVLVNNAAQVASWTETIGTADLDAAHRVFETNVFGPWRTAQAFLPLLRQSPQGRIVNVSSGAGSHGDPVYGLTRQAGNVSYGVSKAALNALTAKLAVEVKDTPILVNAVCPGFTATAPGMAEMGARPVAEGAAGIVRAATLPPGGPSGGLFRDGQQLPW